MWARNTWNRCGEALRELKLNFRQYSWFNHDGERDLEECPICFQPQYLFPVCSSDKSIDHVVCSKCMGNLKRFNKANCPVCREPMKIIQYKINKSEEISRKLETRTLVYLNRVYNRKIQKDIHIAKAKREADRAERGMILEEKLASIQEKIRNFQGDSETLRKLKEDLYDVKFDLVAEGYHSDSEGTIEDSSFEDGDEDF